MSMETLQSDMEGVTSAVSLLEPSSSSAAVVSFIKNELWPFITNHVAETAEIDEIVEDIVDNSEDIIQPETARIFAAVIAGGAVMVAALRARIARETDPQLFKVIAEFEANLKAAGEILEEVVIPPEGDDGDDESEDDDDQDDEDDDESDEPDEGDEP